MLLTTDKKVNANNKSSEKHFNQNNLSLSYNDIELQITRCEKHLGVHLEWNNHFQHICKTTSSSLWLFSQIRSYLSQQDRVLYYVYIKPHFEYCCTIWGNSFDYNQYKVEKLQRRAGDIILGKVYVTLEVVLKS